MEHGAPRRKWGGGVAARAVGTAAVMVATMSLSCGGGQRIEMGSIFEMVTAPVETIDVGSPVIAGKAARLSVTGTFPDRCTELDRYVAEIDGGRIEVMVYAKRNISGCDAAPIGFSGEYFINGLSAGVYQVRVNRDDALRAELAVLQGSDVDPDGGSTCTGTHLDFDPDSVSFPPTMVEGQDLVVGMTVVAPDTCTTFSGIDAAVEGTGIVLSIDGLDCPAAAGCQEIAQTFEVEQRVSGLAEGAYALFVNGVNVGVVRVLAASQCSTSLAPVSAVSVPASVREGGAVDAKVTGSKPDNFSLAPFVEARTEGDVELTLEMYGCSGDPAGSAPFEAAYEITGLSAGTWVVEVNGMASASVAVLPACERKAAPTGFADIYSSLWESGNGKSVPVGTPVDAVVGGTFVNDCWSFDGFEYAREGTTITLDAMALYCPGVCGDKTVDFRATYTFVGLEPGHYTLTINGTNVFTFDVVP